MQNFTNYIKESANDCISESLLSHIAIEYKVNDIGEGRRIVNEKYGIYDGCEELANYITNDIFSRHAFDDASQYSKENLGDIKNIFFKELTVDIDTSSDDGGECDDEISIGNDLLIDEIYINIYLGNPTKSEIKGILMHELTHIYNNYIMQLKGDKNFIKTSRSAMYQNIIDMSGGPIERDIKTVLYFLLGYERNAFIAQLKAELEDHKDKINTPREALEILKNCSIYKTYMRINNILTRHISNQNENPDSQLIAQIYKQITGDKSNESSMKILKRLKSQSNKAIKKLNTVIPKLCVENLNNRKWHREIYPI